MWIPAAAQKAMAQEREQHNRFLLQQMEEEGVLKGWSAELRRIDPYLHVIRAHENARHPALKPGLYHFVRAQPGMPATVIPIQGPAGEFRELDSSVFEDLRRSDLWNDGAQRDRENAVHQLELAKKRQRKREQDDRVTEVLERAKSVVNPSVSMADAGKWRYRAGARTEKKAA